MHIIEFLFKFEPELNLFLVRLDFLGEFFLNLLPEELFFNLLLLKLVLILLE